ncbi:MAG: SAM-dependent chlorinase/fluorinase [Pseudomonadota bacterium]|nr:SAM-dependent chlorinase/fluorinase [Pseudomonadota bacterium]
MSNKLNTILTFTDFGATGPYLGQMEAAIKRESASACVIHLQSDAPACNPKSAGYLLAALANQFDEAVFLCVVDPGVGSERCPLVIESQGQWFVGPDNGLFAPLYQQRDEMRIYRILQPPLGDSETFHGRDLFASVSAKILNKQYVTMENKSKLDVGSGWKKDLNEIIYVDHFGNLFTGLRGCLVQHSARVHIAGRELSWAPRFDAVAQGEAFWYVNSCGLIEIAVNGGRADMMFAKYRNEIIKTI